MWTAGSMDSVLTTSPTQQQTLSKLNQYALVPNQRSQTLKNTVTIVTASFWLEVLFCFVFSHVLAGKCFSLSLSLCLSFSSSEGDNWRLGPSKYLSRFYLSHILDRTLSSLSPAYVEYGFLPFVQQPTLYLDLHLYTLNTFLSLDEAVSWLWVFAQSNNLLYLC